MVFSTAARMAADHSEHSAERLRRRGTRLAVLFLAFMLGALAVGAWQLAHSQSNTRKQLRQGYNNRATTVAGVLQSLFGAAFQQGAATNAKLYGASVTTAQMLWLPKSSGPVRQYPSR